ncbi:hypothetical protein HZH68_011055 [Vespula germanica]|uniref:Uncharacterized protein n=1 Tax=Vespula germanica TaxID=30212 RepID=A0A834JQJ9_VESGE|nr:hypothetical protein HZH68_011055 [Vespula germanica]
MNEDDDIEGTRLSINRSHREHRYDDNDDPLPLTGLLLQISLASGVAGGVARNGHFLIAPNDLEKKSSGSVVAIARANRSAAFGSAIILASLGQRPTRAEIRNYPNRGSVSQTRACNSAHQDDDVFRVKNITSQSVELDGASSSKPTALKVLRLEFRKKVFLGSIARSSTG